MKFGQEHALQQHKVVQNFRVCLLKKNKKRQYKVLPIYVADLQCDYMAFCISWIMIRR